MLAAIEMYNKPRLEYRDEIVVILLLNAWELLLKAVVSKNRKSIYYRKERGKPYRTVGWRDALLRAEPHIPHSIPARALEANLNHLSVYRDSAVHFYNAPGFGILIYGLGQTSIVNFRDVLRDVFNQDLSDEISWRLLPLALEPPIDPLTYLRGPRSDEASGAVDEFLRSLGAAADELAAAGIDTSRLMTVYDVSLQSIKKIESADVVVGVDGAAGGGEPTYIERRIQPHISHPYRRRDVLRELSSFLVDGRPFNRYDFDAVVHARDLKNNQQMCYRDDDANLTRWSAEIVPLIRRTAATEIGEARQALSASRRRR